MKGDSLGREGTRTGRVSSDLKPKDLFPEKCLVRSGSWNSGSTVRRLSEDGGT